MISSPWFGSSIATDVLARAGRFKQVRDNLRVKEVFVGKASIVVATSSSTTRRRPSGSAPIATSCSRNSKPIEAQFGSFEQAPFDRASSQQVWIARRP